MTFWSPWTLGLYKPKSLIDMQSNSLNWKLCLSLQYAFKQVNTDSLKNIKILGRIVIIVIYHFVKWAHLCSCASSIRTCSVPICFSSLCCPAMWYKSPMCLFSCCFQIQRRDQPRDFLWTASSITHLCCSARKTTCCTSEPGRHCLPSASPTSARPSCRRTWVCRKCQSQKLLCWSWAWFAGSVRQIIQGPGSCQEVCNNVVSKYKYSVKCKMQLTSLRMLFVASKRYFPYIFILKEQSSSWDVVESAWFPLFHMTYSGFLFHLQLTWGTPAGKREECSFKGKNLEVRGTLTAPAKQEIMKMPPKNTFIFVLLGFTRQR